MAYFNYHAKAKNLIKTNHLIAVTIFEKYHHIYPAMVLYFDVSKPIPIREYMWEDYIPLINQVNVKIEDNRTKKGIIKCLFY